MICVDTNIWIPYLAGDLSPESEILDNHLAFRSALMSPVVLAELLSHPGLPVDLVRTLSAVPQLQITHGFWQRAGLTRAALAKYKIRPRLADTLIAQTCIDARVPLLTRDEGFRVFAKYAGLKLV